MKTEKKHIKFVSTACWCVGNLKKPWRDFPNFHVACYAPYTRDGYQIGPSTCKYSFGRTTNHAMYGRKFECLEQVDQRWAIFHAFRLYRGHAQCTRWDCTVKTKLQFLGGRSHFDCPGTNPNVASKMVPNFCKYTAPLRWCCSCRGAPPYNPYGIRLCSCHGKSYLRGLREEDKAAAGTRRCGARGEGVEGGVPGETAFVQQPLGVRWSQSLFRCIIITRIIIIFFFYCCCSKVVCVRVKAPCLINSLVLP